MFGMGVDRCNWKGFIFQNLTEINVSWCNLITENGVEAIARGCNKIKKFSSKGKSTKQIIAIRY